MWHVDRQVEMQIQFHLFYILLERLILTRISGGYEFFMQTSFDSNCLKSSSSEVKVRCELSASDVHTWNWSDGEKLFSLAK